MKKYLVYGSVNIDYVYQLDHIVRPGETEASEKLSKNAGGKGLNQAIALSKAGAETYFAGCIGPDGVFLKETLEQYGVNTEHLIKGNVPNGNAIIQVDAMGQNSIILYGGSNQAITEKQIRETLSAFTPGDLLLMQNEISCGDILLEKAHEAGLLVAVNPSPITKDLLNWPLKLSNYILLNETEGEALSGLKEPAQMISFFQREYPNTNVVLTLGAQGAYSIFHEECFYQPAFKVSVVDTTAAGDTFTGYYLHSICNGADAKAALWTAARASSIAIGISGAAKSIPARDQLNDYRIG